MKKGMGYAAWLEKRSGTGVESGRAVQTISTQPEGVAECIRPQGPSQPSSKRLNNCRSDMFTQPG